MKNSVSRRGFFRVGMGAAGTLVASRTLAELCGKTTGEQPLGPFFPKPGTPEDPIREDRNPATPIYLANDGDLTIVKGRSGLADGQKVYVKGQVTNAACQPIPNATLIVWQASKSGRYNHKGDDENHDFHHPKTGEIIKRTMDHSFQYWGKILTNENGEYEFKTIVPGFYPADLQSGWYRPPHIHFMVSATGYPQLVTQLYFKSDKIDNNEWIQELNEKDAILQVSSITAEQRERLIVEFVESKDPSYGDGLLGQFNISLAR